MNYKDLRIVFMGTPEFAVATLKALVEGEWNVVAVVTQPDKPVGRHGSVLQPSPVKQYALENGLPVLQPEKMKDPAFIEELRSYDANLFVVVAFRMLPEVVWAMPEYGTFNVHAALLPQYRGAAPINWAVINGETQTGVTTFFLDKDIDTGRVIMQLPFDILPEYNVENVYNGLMQLGADICLKTLQKIVESDGHPSSMPQEEMIGVGETLHHAPKIFKETCEINWNSAARDIHNFVRGLSPVPGAWTTLIDQTGKETVLKVYHTLYNICAREGSTAEGISEAANENTSAPSCESLTPGTMLLQDKHLCVMCGDGNLIELIEIQLAGKKRMTVRDFLNGMKNIEECRLKSD